MLASSANDSKVRDSLGIKHCGQVYKLCVQEVLDKTVSTTKKTCIMGNKQGIAQLSFSVDKQGKILNLGLLKFFKLSEQRA